MIRTRIKKWFSRNDTKEVDPRFFDGTLKSGEIISLRPGPNVEWSHKTTRFTLERGRERFETLVYHPYLAVLKTIQDHEFKTVLDIGSGDGHEAKLFKFLGKEVSTINADPNPEYKVDFFGDYLDYRPGKKFDLIWCSHVLEHVRHPGLFLDKIYDDLLEGGHACITVPLNEFGGPPGAFNCGHHNRYNGPVLVYQLVCAGFDCSRDFSMRVYDGQVSVIVKKHAHRSVTCDTSMAEFRGDMIEPFFPKELWPQGSSTESINWR